MTDAVTFFVPGRPFSKKRPRFGKGRTYTDPETVAAESAVRWFAQRALPSDFEPLKGPVRMRVAFYFARAARQSAETKSNFWHVQRPDASNMQKLVEDALNPLPKQTMTLWRGIWLDDSQLCDVHVTKHWADDEHPEGSYVEISQICL